MSMDQRPIPKPMGRLIGCIVSLIVLGAIGLGFALYYLLPGQAVNSIDELDTASIKSFRVYFLNRKELDEGDDIGPYFASPADYDTLLKPLRSLEEVDDFPNAKGPWLGEYRIGMKNGRNATIKIYWSRPAGGQEMLAPFGSLTGSAAAINAQYSKHIPPAELRIQIGPYKAMGGSAMDLVQRAEECAPRGTQR